MTIDDMVVLLTTEEPTDETAVAVVQLLKEHGREALRQLQKNVSRERLHALSVKLKDNAEYMVFVEKVAKEREETAHVCEKNDTKVHCLHNELVFTSGEFEIARRTGCCFCGELFDLDKTVTVPDSAKPHGGYCYPSRDEMVKQKNQLIIDGRLAAESVDLEQREDAVDWLYSAALWERILSETAETDPNGPSKEDHLKSAENLRTLALSVRTKGM